MTRREAVERMAGEIEPLYGRREALAIARRAVCALGGFDFTQLVVDAAAPFAHEDYLAVLEELRRGRPLQYVLGSEEFCGLTLGVDERVLIPRPETEELVVWCAAQQSPRARILDVGTGSGCIALALAKRLPQAEVTAVDLSAGALDVARGNAASVGAHVRLLQSDALAGLPGVDGPFDAIVSNPPYIPLGERAQMHANVRDWEPSLALFVPDDDPLRFYRAIARAGARLLAPGGGLWFEIHAPQSDALAGLLADEGYPHIACRCDMNDKPRMIWARRS